MRVELVRGRYLLCGGILNPSDVKVGQVWAAADGSDHTVQVDAVSGDWVYYSWKGKSHSKLSFAFQCRYCLVLDGPEIPEHLA